MADNRGEGLVSTEYRNLFHYKHFPNYTRYLPECLGLLKLCTSRKYTHVQRSPLEIQTATQWNAYGCSITCVIAQQYSYAIFTSLHFHFRKEKFSAFKIRCYSFLIFSTFASFWNCVTSNYPKSEAVFIEWSPHLWQGMCWKRSDMSWIKSELFFSR
jgi:hypothetical protein